MFNDETKTGKPEIGKPEWHSQFNISRYQQ